MFTLSGNWLKVLKRRKLQKKLAAAVALGLLCGTYLPGAQAAEYTGKVTSNVTEDNKVLPGKAVFDEAADTVRYTFTENTMINNSYTWQELAAMGITADNQGYISTIQPGGPTAPNVKSGEYHNMLFNLNGHNLTVNHVVDTGIGQIDPARPTVGAYISSTPLYVEKPVSITFDNVGKLTLNNQSTGYYLAGIYAGYYRGLGTEEKELAAGRPAIIINNAGGWDNAVTVTAGGGQYSENITGVKIFNRGELIIKGYADFAKDTKDAQGKILSTKYFGLDVNTMGNRVETSAHLSLGGGRWGTIYGYGNSLLELNTVKDSAGNVTATNNDVMMVGDIQTKAAYSTDITTVNLGLTTKDSFWQGATNAGTDNQVENLFIQNGGSWINNAARVSNIIKLHGGTTADTAGVLKFSNTTAGASIDKYDGHVVAMYAHADATPSTMLGGNITIKSAAAGSEITLQTGSNGIDVTNHAIVSGVFDSLANKLFYTGYITGERNLTGKVKIAEGLTTESAEKAIGDIWYDPANGQGNYIQQAVTDYTTTLTGTAADLPYIAGGVYYANGDIRSKKATSISVADAPAIDVGKNIDLVIDMLGSNWNIAAASDQNEITAVAVDNNGSLTVNNMGTVTVGANGRNAVGFYAGIGTGGAVADKASITIKNKNTPIIFTGDPNYAYTAVKAGKQGNITIGAPIQLAGELQNSVNSTVFDADGGTIAYNGRVKNILKTNGYLVKASNGATVRLGDLNYGAATELRGDILISKGTSTADNLTNVFLNVNKMQTWTGSAGGDGIFEMRMGTSGTTADFGGTWYNRWLNGSQADTRVSELTVGSTMPSSIYQQNAGKLYLDKVSDGVLNIYYEHAQDNVANFAAGDTVIGHGETNSGNKTELTLKTDSTGIDMNNKTQVNSVLQALAKKLTYTGYASGERDVNGHAEIMEGLLNSSAKLAGGLIGFNETTGQGFYAPQTANSFTTAITGGTDEEYALHGVKSGSDYLFKEDTTINTVYDKNGAVYAAVDVGAGKTVTMKTDGNLLKVQSSATVADAGTGYAAGINVRKGGTLTANNGNLLITAGGNVKDVYGIYADGDPAAAAGDMVTITQKTMNGGFNDGNVLKITGTAGEGGKFTAIKANNNAGITITSKLKIDAQAGIGIVADNGSNVDISVAVDTYNADKQSSYLDATGGIAITAGKNSKVTLSNLKTGDYVKGDIYTDIAGEGGRVDLALSSNTHWTGGAQGQGIFNLSLSSALALWTNQWQQGSGDTHVTLLKGPSNSYAGFGVIYQKNSGKLEVDSFAGITAVHYDHDGTDPTKLTGGDAVIKSSVSGAGYSKNNVVFVRTDTAGIDLSNTLQVNKILNALANKLYYTDAIQGGSSGGYSLIGSAAITETVTGGSKTDLGVRSGAIAFNTKTGQGYYYYAAPEQVATEFGSTLTGHNQIRDSKTTDYEYAQGGVIDSEGNYAFKTAGTAVANKIAVDDVDTVTIGSGESAITAVSGIAAQDAGIKATAENTLDVTAKATEAGKAAISVYTAAGRTADLSADNLALTASSEKGNAYGIYNEGTATIAKNLSVQSTGTGILAASGNVKVDGHTIINAGGIGVQAGATGVVQLASAEIKSGEGKAAIDAAGGSILLNTGETGQAVVAGDIIASSGGTVDVSFNNSDASFHGNIINDSSTVNMKLKNGAVWTNTAKDSGNASAVINSFTGGDSKANAGIIKQENSNKITINNYSGSAKFIYAHDENDPANILGGGVVIGTATQGSTISLVTDYKGIGAGNEAVLSVFEAMANKVTYEEAVKNNLTAALADSSNSGKLSGTLEIAEGLLTSSAALKTSDLSFDNQGKGHVGGTVLDVDPATGNTTEHTPEITYGNKQTAMMRGAKSAMVSSALVWRAENNDVLKRLGDLRLDPKAEEGLWVKMGGGKTSYEQDNTEFKTDFKTYQLGYDKTVGKAGWRLGAAVSYLKGDSTYEAGSGDNRSTSLSLYGSWLGEKGRYADIILRGSKVKADYTVYNDYGYKLNGEYDTTGMAASAEYGQRIKTGSKGFYYEPQVELTYSRLGSDSYGAHSDYLNGTALQVKQDSFDSLIGRVGIGAGIQNERGSAFVKVSLLHEFLGDFDTSYSAAGEQSKGTSVDFGGTWVNLQLGGTTKLSNNSYAYATFEKSFSGDVKTDWRVDGGFRFTF
jgi:outer membrane autotransporter protein